MDMRVRIVACVGLFDSNCGLTYRLALLHDQGFDYTSHDDGSLGHLRPYASPEELANDNAANAFRSDGYGMLAHPVLHSVPLSTSAKAIRCSSNPGVLDLPP